MILYVLTCTATPHPEPIHSTPTEGQRRWTHTRGSGSGDGRHQRWGWGPCCWVRACCVCTGIDITPPFTLPLARSLACVWPVMMPYFIDDSAILTPFSKKKGCDLKPLVGAPSELAPTRARIYEEEEEERVCYMDVHIHRTHPPFHPSTSTKQSHDRSSGGSGSNIGTAGRLLHCSCSCCLPPPAASPCQQLQQPEQQPTLPFHPLLPLLLPTTNTIQPS